MRFATEPAQCIVLVQTSSTYQRVCECVLGNLDNTRGALADGASECVERDLIWNLWFLWDWCLGLCIVLVLLLVLLVLLVLLILLLLLLILLLLQLSSDGGGRVVLWTAPLLLVLLRLLLSGALCHHLSLCKCNTSPNVNSEPEESESEMGLKILAEKNQAGRIYERRNESWLDADVCFVPCDLV